MLNSLYISALGMQVQKSQLDVVSNNLANTNTAGYKRERIDFSAMLDRQAKAGSNSGDPAATAAKSPLRRDLSQGELRATEAPLDVAVNGTGLIEVRLSDDRVGYVRGGSLRINADGYLTIASGEVLKADIRVPANASDINIDAHGVVTAKLGGEAQATELGRLQLVSFTNADMLNYLGNGVFTTAEGQEVATRGNPEEDGLGSIAGRKLEMSNVKVVDEMVSLMLAQRVYELNSKVVQAADELMAMANSLRRG
ncbi:MAG: flagellar hook-basal body complex protein [Rubrivivax sp.]|nr:MAG: flagellar hook-basal body complex protein [Rubrivivax sp.]